VCDMPYVNQASLTTGHYNAVSTYDTLAESVILLFDIVIGANWYKNTVEVHPKP